MHIGTSRPSAATGGISPERSIEMLARHDGPLIVDLDETLYLRNSTEDFVDCAAPGLLGRLLFKALDVLRPWSLTGGRKTRDAWRVRLAALMPFAMSRWRRRAATLARTQTNAPVAAVLRDRPDAVIATLGFEPIVRPLLAAMGLGGHRLVASRMGSIADRRDGKLARTHAVLGEPFVRDAAVLTDSTDDQDLLDRSALPLLVKWPGARFVPAQSSIYLPLEYTHRVKRPGQGFIHRAILGDDYALWVLASVTLASALLPHVLGLLLLVLSFWTVYELGYVDNDWVAANYEERPVLTPEYHTVPVATSYHQAWLWAIGLGIAGIAVLEQTLTPHPLSVLAWFGALVATFGVYLLYNRVDKDTRIWLYALLQVARAAAFVVVLPVPVIGAMALAAHALSRWVFYFFYRAAGGVWPVEHSLNVVRLLFYAIMTGFYFASAGWDRDAAIVALLLGIWFVLRAGPRLLAVVTGARMLTARRLHRSAGRASR